MADAVVSFAVDKLGSFIIQEIAVMQNVRTNIEWLRNEFGYMRSFMKDAEEKQGSDHRVQQWISEITDVAYDTLSILEEFTLKVEGGYGDGTTPKLGFFNRLGTWARIGVRKGNLHNIGKEIEAIKERLLDISRKRETYGIRNIGDAGEGPSSFCSKSRSIIRTIRRANSYADEEQLFVGFEDVTKTLLNEILKDEPRRCVVSILGMGGLGKTTVARKLYNSPAVLRTFPFRAWVCLSQEYSILDLLQTIIRSFIKGANKKLLAKLGTMTMADLERELYKMLEGQRYLVVVDDVWHKEAWESLKRGFPDCRNGSRVIITTRKKDVATRTDEKCFVHQLRFLTPEESWDLFCKKLSYGCDDHGDWPSIAMLDLGREMVHKCSGLPLAIIVLGGLLCHKRTLEEWQKVKEHLWRLMKTDSVEISLLLSLSYNDLSSELKLCFLYLGIFPEDYLINTEKLMWLWMAEGFIQGGDQRIEDIAEDYLNELFDRNLIQVAEKFWGQIFTCRIHDLLHDLAVEKAMEVRFFNIYDPHKYSPALSCRRHAIHNSIREYLSLAFSNPMLRSTLFFNPDRELPKLERLASACSNFKYLCVLDLENVRFRSASSSASNSSSAAPSNIGSLIHLRYLGLTNSNIKIFPKSIGNLKSLQILDALLPEYGRCMLPPDLRKLTNLRHIVCRFDGGSNLSTLTNLRTLRYVNYDQWTDFDTANLINLRELAIEGIKPLLKKAYSLDSVGNLRSLRSLFLCCLGSQNAFPQLQPLSSCQRLVKLWLKGKVENLSSLNELPQSITELTLTDSLLDEDPMPVLETMPNLRSLDMDGCYTGSKILCGAKGFPQLEFLHLSRWNNLEIWELENEGLPLIRGLGIYKCPKLKMVPERLESVPVLHELKNKYVDHIRRPNFWW